MTVTTAYIYTRVSTQSQADENHSLPMQLTECRRYAAAQGWAIGPEYQDIESGTKDSRPGYLRLLADIRTRHDRGDDVVLLVWKLDRLGRSIRERLRAWDELTVRGREIGIWSVRDGGKQTRFVYNILATVADEERRQISERVSANLRHMTAKGWRLTSHVPLGYERRAATEDERQRGSGRNVLAVNDDEAWLVREIFRRIADGASLRDTTIWASGQTSDARGHRRLPFSAIQYMLRSPVYEPGAGNWPAILDEKTWQHARERIGLWCRLRNQATDHFLLTGLIRCGECGEGMGGATSGRNRRYRCYGYTKGARAERPSCNWSCHVATLDALVLDTVCRTVHTITSSPDVARRIEQRWSALRRPSAQEIDQQRRALQEQQRRARERLSGAAIALVDGALDRAGYEAARETIEADLRASSAALTSLDHVEPMSVLPSITALLARTQGWGDALAGYRMEDQRLTLAYLINQVRPTRLPGRLHYDIAITWTPMGETLRRVAEEMRRDVA